MKCKFEIKRKRRKRSLGFNRSIMKCKFMKCKDNTIKVKCFNRSIMKCKFEELWHEGKKVAVF